MPTATAVALINTSPGCPKIDSAQLHLKVNSLNQVIVHWDVLGGCAPYQGSITAWYQNEMKPYAIYPISSAKGQLLDAPILHRGTWDIDYTLNLRDAGGHTIETFETIGVGR
jgi:hypothetical protein